MSIAGLDHIGHKPGTTEKTLGQVPAWLWFGAGLFLLFVIGGNRALQDADTYWQIVVGQSIIDHRALPQTDVEGWCREAALPAESEECKFVSL